MKDLRFLQLCPKIFNLIVQISCSLSVYAMAGRVAEVEAIAYEVLTKYCSRVLTKACL